MKKKFFTLLLNVLLIGLLQAQTWTGNTSTDWNTAGNWSPATVPSVTGAVTIPNTVNKPVLAGNVSVASLSMAAGSALNFNGFTLTLSAAADIAGAIFNNTNAATDIVFTIANAGGGVGNYLGAITINDNITINYNGSGTIYEGYITGNTYNGNAIFNIGGSGTFYTSYSQKCTFGGSLTINRSTAGPTYIFYNGSNTIAGNFSYSNIAGGVSSIDYAGSAYATVAGTVNITTGGAGSPGFEINRVKNLTTGGTISIQNSGLTTIVNDTLQLAALNVNGFTGAGGDELRGNVITGNVSFSDAAANTGATYIGGNTITGNTTFTFNAANTIYESYINSDVYNGSTVFNVAGTSTFYTSYSQKCSFNGSLTVNRTGAGSTYIFYNGSNTIAGNFSYSNTAGGLSSIDYAGSAYATIAGTVNITATGTGNPGFEMNRVKNLTTGGTISVQNSGLITIKNDTLQVAALNVDGFTGSGGDELQGNVITGNVSFSDAAANTGSTYIGGNTITGNTAFTFNAANTTYEGYIVGDVYNGNTSFDINGSVTLYTSYSQKGTYNGNLTINRSGNGGTTYIFYNGSNTVVGNVSYSNTAGGLTVIDYAGSAYVSITGTVNITATGAGNPGFEMNRVKNLTTGGTISVQNSGLITIVNDTLQLIALNVNGFTGSGGDELRGSIITGNVIFSDAAANTGAVYIGGNTITGTTAFTANSPTTWYESYVNSDTYNGNLLFTRIAGTINFAYSDTTYTNQNVVFNATTGVDINTAINFGGSNNAIIEQLGTQPLSMPGLVMIKTGGARLTLSDSVIVTNAAAFFSGNIYSSAGNNLIFPDNSSAVGASAVSHVVGPVTKVGDDMFNFPVGGPVTYNPVTMSAPVGFTSRFRAEYKSQNPTIDGFNTNSKAGSFGIAVISNAGYWDVQRLLGATNVTLRLGFNANPYEEYPVLANLKVAHWNGTQWDDHGNGGTTGTPASGTVVNAVPITSFSPFAIAGVVPTYFFSYGQPGPGPDGSPIKLKGIGGYPGYMVKQLPGGSYTTDSIFLVPNGSTNTFRLKDANGVEKDTTITAPAAPAAYIAANGSGTVNFTGWRHFVYLRNAGNEIIGAIRDNNLTLGNTTMAAYFSAANVATAPNGGIFLKRSFRITSQFAPVGTKRVRFYITKTEVNDLMAADPASFPNGINSLTIIKYTGPQEGNLFNPIPGGNAVIIPNSDIAIADLGTMYSLDIDVTGFSGFYIGGNNSNLTVCSGSSITLPSNITGGSYQWQVNDGSGFANISDGGPYSGTGTALLTIANAPQSLYGYQFRAVVNGSSLSQVYTLKFNTSWEGTVSTAWENVANWSCGVLPDANTDVIINAGKPNYPQLNSNATIRSLRLNNGASGTVKAGFTLTILK